MNQPGIRVGIWPWLLALVLVAVGTYWLGSRGTRGPASTPTAAQIAAGGTTASPPRVSLPRERRDASRRVHGNSGDSRDSNPSMPSGALPAQAGDTIRLIRQGGPFPFRQDGVVFGNREGLLPRQPNGYYHEYTVITPGASNRATRRIVTGGTPPAEWYYTDDHYRSFRRFSPDRREAGLQ